MSAGILTIDLDALVANWRRLAAMAAPGTRTGAVVKADGYGLGAAPVARALATAGARNFFVAIAEEGVALRQALGPGPAIHVFSGFMPGDTEAMAGASLIPLLNSPEQIAAFTAALPGAPHGLQLDTGMNRLGLEAGDIAAAATLSPVLVMSHLACADTPAHPMNAAQLDIFTGMTQAFPGVPRSLAATGGILLGPDYHFEMTRPGIGLYGGLPFAEASPVVALDLPVIQTRPVARGETVGYANAWTAPRASRIATVAAGYADGLHRALADGRLMAWAGDAPCPVVGRISMDLITVDVTGIDPVPRHLSLITRHQGVDRLAAAAGTIGYEVLTGLGHRYDRLYMPPR